MEEIKKLYERGVRFFVYNDDNFTSDRKRAIEICKMMVKEGLNKKMGWQCRAEVSLMNEDLVYWMKEAQGLRSLALPSFSTSRPAEFESHLLGSQEVEQ